MRSVTEIKTRRKELESLKAELLQINDEAAIKMVTRLDIEVEQLNWVLGLD